MKFSRVTSFAKATLLAVCVAVAIAGCAKKQESKEGPVLRAYRLIDKQRTSEAIALLEAELEKDPQNYQYKVVLASAYAHKGGIKVQKLIPILSQTDKIKSMNQTPRKKKTHEQLGQKINLAALNLAAMLNGFAGFFQVYASVPVITPEQATYVQHSITLLNELGDRIKPEDALYRGVLEVVLFKEIFAEGLIGEFVAPKDTKIEDCRVNVGEVNDTLVQLGKLLIDVFTDIGIANPKQAKDMKKLADNAAEATTNFTLATTTLTVLDEMSTVFLRETAIQNGFGKIIKCSGG